MTNNNNRSADDVIVYLPNGFSPVKPINLSELAEECKRKEIIGQPEITGWNNGIEYFLSKIREAMK